MPNNFERVPGLCFSFFSELLKEAKKVVRIVARGPHVLRAEFVRLGLNVAAEFQEGQRHANLRSLVSNVSEPAGHKDQRYHRVICKSSLRRLLDSVPRSHVSTRLSPASLLSN